MSEMFCINDKLGDIVVQFPQAADIFKKHRIDFCCGGDQPLSHAVEEHHVDGNNLLAELNQTYEEARRQGVEMTDWTQVPYERLIHHIMNTHHAYLHQVFPPLAELTTKILRVHGQNHGELSKVHRLFAQLRMDMEEHMIKEEESVFPQIITYERYPTAWGLEAVIRAVEELDREHDGTGDVIKELRRVTDNYKLPEDACGTYTYVYEKLQELESDVFQHIHLENNVLFVRLQAERQRFGQS